MSESTRYLRICSVVTVGALGGIALLNWRVDPLQHYRPASYPPLLVEPGRFRLPGVARHTTAELAIAGTSVSRNQQPAEAEHIFQKKTLNLAMDGASAHEQFLLLRLALQTGRVKEVIWDVNFEYLRGKPDWVSDYDGAFPGYLYDDFAGNDLPRYLLSLDTCKNTARILARKAGLAAYPDRSIASFQAFDAKKAYGNDAVERSMERRRKGVAAFRALIPQFTSQQLATSFSANYLALIKAHPEVRFRLYFPPFSKAYFDFLREYAPELLPVFRAYRRDVVAALQGLPNAELHDPQSDIALIEDLTHFADPIHFDPATHTRLLEGIHQGKWRSSPDRLESFERWLK